MGFERHLPCPRPAGVPPGHPAHPLSGTPAGTPSLCRSCCRYPDSRRKGRFRRPWRRSCRRSGRASHCRARGPGSAGTSLRMSAAWAVTGKRGCRAGGCPMQPPSPGTYLPYCRCKGAGVPRPSPPRGAGLLSVPSAWGRKRRAAISPCLWDLPPTPPPLDPHCPCDGQLCWVLQLVQAPALLGATGTLPAIDRGLLGCDPSTPRGLPSPVLIPGGCQDSVFWLKTPKVPQSSPVLGTCLLSLMQDGVSSRCVTCSQVNWAVSPMKVPFPLENPSKPCEVRRCWVTVAKGSVGC